MALLAVACSAPRLVYDRLDWLASWQIGRYVDLDPAQRRRLAVELGSLQNWHRAAELPRYSEDFAELASVTQRALSAAEITAWSERIDGHWNRLVIRAAPAVCEQMASFSDVQVESVLQRVSLSIDEDAEDLADQTEAENREDDRKRLLKTVGRWIGDLDEAQRIRISTWTANRELTDLHWLERRRQWRDRLATVLAARRSATFCAETTALLDGSDARASGDVQQRSDTARASWTGLVADLSATLSPGQRKHLRAELLELSEDFEVLAARRQD